MLPSQVSAPEPNYNTEQAPMLSSQMQRTMSMSQVSSSQYGTPYESPEMMRYPTATSASRKRSLPEDYYDYQRTQPVHANASNPNASAQSAVSMQPGYSQVHPNASSYYLSSQHPYSQGEAQIYQPPVHHHHRLPNHPPPSKSQRLSDAGEEHTSVVGQPGMPSPAARPKGPKLKFTAEDDALLVELKETKNLTWKQIADFFPGRSSGTLQVRYCTKLKAKTTTWTDDMVRCSLPYQPSRSIASMVVQRLTAMIYMYNGFALRQQNMKSTDGGSSPAKSAMVSPRPLARRRRWNWKPKRAVRSRRLRPDSSDAHRRPHPPTRTRTLHEDACLTSHNV